MENKVSLVEEAYEKIKQKICDFELYPGQEISDFTLSKELGMSRTPIRQALGQLENDGLIFDGGQGRGYIVCEITEEEIRDIFAARECIETMSLKLAMEQGIKEESFAYLEKINRQMEEMDQKGNIKRQFYFDQQFHNYLVLLSGNKRLIRFYETLRIQLSRLRVLSYLERSYQKKAYNDHSRVIECIREKDGEGAVRALTVHIETSQDDYCDLLTNRIALDSYGMLRFLMKTTEGDEEIG
nr:GntR family transcriptional regulator [Clostridium sp. MCC353]